MVASLSLPTKDIMNKKKKKEDLDTLDEIVLETILSQVKHQFLAIAGNTYFLYQRHEGGYFVSMVSPQEWTQSKFRFLTKVRFNTNNSWEQIKD